MNHEVFESWLRYLNSQLRRGMAGQNLYQEHSPQTMEKRPTLAPKQQLQAVMSESKMIFLNLTFTISQTTATAGIMQLNLVPQIKSTINATCLNHPTLHLLCTLFLLLLHQLHLRSSGIRSWRLGTLDLRKWSRNICRTQLSWTQGWNYSNRGIRFRESGNSGFRSRGQKNLVNELTVICLRSSHWSLHRAIDTSWELIPALQPLPSSKGLFTFSTSHKGVDTSKTKLSERHNWCNEKNTRLRIRTSWVWIAVLIHMSYAVLSKSFNLCDPQFSPVVKMELAICPHGAAGKIIWQWVWKKVVRKWVPFPLLPQNQGTGAWCFP